MPSSRAEQPLRTWAAPDSERALELAALLLEPVEENAILRRTVAALAAPGGFGFTRAFLFFADAERGVLAGRHAVGPSDLAEATRLAQATSGAGDDVADLLSTLRALDDDALESAAPTATARLRGLTLPLVEGLDPVLDHCLEHGTGRFVAGAGRQPAVRAVWGERLALSGFAAAIVRAAGRPVALLVADRGFAGGTLGPADEARLGQVAGLAGHAVERARTARENTERGGQLATLEEAGLSAVRATSLRSELALLVRAATQTLSCRGGVLWRSSGERAVLLLESVHVSDDRCDPLRQAEALEPLARTVLREDAPRAVADAAADPALDPAAVRGFGAAFAVPVPGLTRAAGVLVLWGPAPRALAEPGRFDRDDMRFATALATTLGAVLAQAGLSERVRQAESRLGDAKKQLATVERLAALGELAARAAQEVKNPLASIGGFARRAHKGMAEGDPNREYVEIILRESERIERLLAEQLQFVKLSRPRLGLESVNHIIGVALTARTEPMTKKRVRLLKKLAPDVPTLLLDAEKIQQVVANMLDSALENVPGNGRVRVETRRAQGYVVVEIAGEGPPLAGDMLEQLYVPFAASRTSGESVGLALAQQVVQSHGGEIRVRSEGDWGVIFSFTLPVNENEDRRRANDRRGVRNDRRNRFPAA